MSKQKKTWIRLSLIALGLMSMTLSVGCAKQSEFVFAEGYDRMWLDEGQDIKAPTDGVFLSNRAFKYYASK